MSFWLWLLLIWNINYNQGFFYLTNADYFLHDFDGFSGLYFPESKGVTEVYSGAWLTPIQRFYQAEAPLRRSIMHRKQMLEAVTFAVVGSAWGRTAMTRDFFDFQVIHLSSTTNTLPGETSLAFRNSILKKIRWSIASLKRQYYNSSSIMPLFQDKRLLNDTVVVLTYCSKAVSEDSSIFQESARMLYIQATFWSIRRYFVNIIIFVGIRGDKTVLELLNLPAWQIIDLSHLFNPNAKPRARDSTHGLPREALLYTMNKLQNYTEEDDPRWATFDYVYYSEGDQMLQLRQASHLYTILKNFGGELVLAPHRLQTIALPKAYPKYQYQWDIKRIRSLENISLTTEDDFISKGSCCDNGRYIFADCGNWWYNCLNWGLQNYTQWVRFGRRGLQMPLGSEHGAKCTYFKRRHKCDLPPASSCPLATSSAQSLPTKFADICIEMLNVERTFG